MAASAPSSLVSHAHFSSLPAVPTTRRPRILPICTTSEPVAPAGPVPTAALGLPISLPAWPAGETGHAEHAQVGWQRQGAVEHAEPLAVRHEVLAPAQHARHEVAQLELGMIRLHPLPHRAPV